MNILNNLNVLPSHVDTVIVLEIIKTRLKLWRCPLTPVTLGVFWICMDCRFAVSLHPMMTTMVCQYYFEVLNCHCSVSISDKLDSLDFWKTQYTLNSVCQNCHNGCVLSPSFPPLSFLDRKNHTLLVTSAGLSLSHLPLSLAQLRPTRWLSFWVTAFLFSTCPFLSVLHCSL